MQIILFPLYNGICVLFCVQKGSAQGRKDDKIQVWKKNPGWEPDFVTAHRINYAGQVNPGVEKESGLGTGFCHRPQDQLCRPGKQHVKVVLLRNGAS
jgi:hypothetical protein